MGDANLSAAFSLMATALIIPLLLTWLSSTPVWVDQWPLKGERLEQTCLLVKQQLEAGHIEPSNSPWNMPIFVVSKKSGKWRLIHDLRKINETLQPMGPLHPGVPNPACIPKDWLLLLIDLKECFSIIPLAEKDREHFAFSLSVINNFQPLQRFQWRVLPQGMLNSPTICQHFIHTAIQPVRDQFPNSIICHYMDDILIPHPSQDILAKTVYFHKNSVASAGLVNAPEKYPAFRTLEIFRLYSF